MISFMFLLMVRVSDPLVPRAIFGVLNTLLFFPSGAIYPTAGFPFWLRWISDVDPFTFAVDALKKLLLKDTGFAGISFDVFVPGRTVVGADQRLHSAFQTTDLRAPILAFRTTAFQAVPGHGQDARGTATNPRTVILARRTHFVPRPAPPLERRGRSNDAF